MADMRNENYPISILAAQVMTRSIPCQLRSGGNTTATTTTKRTKKANDFFTLGSRDSDYYYDTYYCK